MTRDEAKEAICREYERILQGMTGKAKRIKGAQSYICPLCGNGSGSDGDGIIRNPKSDSYGLKCFKCGFSGDIIRLYREHMGADYNTALSLLAQEIGIEIDPYKPDAAADQGIREQKAVQAPQSDYRPADDKNTMQTEKAPENGAQERTEGKADYTEYYKICRERINSPEAASYLSARGISIKTAVAYWIGFDPAADMAKAPGGQGEIKFPCPRIIIPTSKSHYAGRSIDPNTPVQYQKMNVAGGSPGIFNRQALYAQKVQEVFITEGAFDALSIAEAGAAAVALNSTSNADAFIKQLEKEKPAATLIICLDNDEGGGIATKTIIEGLQRLDIPHITADICGQYKDPNEALTKDRAGFIKSVMAAVAAVHKNYIDDFLEKIQTEAYKPYQTDLSFFDDLLNGGVIRQSLLLLMAAPGTGKTTLCQQISEAMAAHQKPVIYLNLEMSREQMLAKAISGRLAKRGKFYSALHIMQGYKWSEAEAAEIKEALQEYSRDIFPYLQYNPDGVGGDLDNILEYLKAVGEQAKAAGAAAPVVVVDYLHLISSRNGMETQELIKQSVTGLKKYAIDYDTFVIGIVATNRISNSSGRITLESGRDSSNIEYTADYQLSLNYYDIDNGKVSPNDPEKIAVLQQQEERQMIIRILKGRFVAPGRAAKVWFNAASNYFYGEDDFRPFRGNSPFDEEEPAAEPKKIPDKELPKPTKVR